MPVTNYLAINRLDAVPLSTLAEEATVDEYCALEFAAVVGVFHRYEKAIGIWHQTPEEGGEAHQQALLEFVLKSPNSVQVPVVRYKNASLIMYVLKLGLRHTAVATRIDDGTAGLFNVWEVWY